MFSSWVCHPALGRPVACEDEDPASKGPGGDVAGYISTLHPKLAGVTPASRLEIRPAPEMASSGIHAMDALTGGLPRGRLTEVCGAASSGRTSVLLAALAAATQRQEACALVDVSDSFDPASAAAAGVDFTRMLWVRCGEVSVRRHRGTENKNYEKGAVRDDAALRSKNAMARSSRLEHMKLAPEGRRDSSPLQRWEKRDKRPSPAGTADLLPPWNCDPQIHPASTDLIPFLQAGKHPDGGRVDQALRATDLLLQSGGFGLVAIDLGDISGKMARRIPLTSWFRFQRVVENTPTLLFAVTPTPCAQACATLVLQLQSAAVSRQSSGRLSAFGSQRSEEETAPAHVQLLEGLHIEGEILRSRLPGSTRLGGAEFAWSAAGREFRIERKPAQSVIAAFSTKTVRTG